MIQPPLGCHICGLAAGPMDTFCARCGAPLWGRVYTPMHVLPAQYGRAHQAPRLGPLLFFGALLAVLVVVAGGLGVAANRLRSPAGGICGFYCGPDTGNAVGLGPTYTNSQYGFTVNYPSGWQTASGSGAVTEQTTDGEFTVYPSRGGADLNSLITNEAQTLGNGNYTQMQTVYAIPGAEIGFTSGQGELYDAFFEPAGAQAEEVRVGIVAATRGNLTVMIVTVSAYSRSKQLSPSGMTEAQSLDYVLSTFEWPGSHSPAS